MLVRLQLSIRMNGRSLLKGNCNSKILLILLHLVGRIRRRKKRSLVLIPMKLIWKNFSINFLKLRRSMRKRMLLMMMMMMMKGKMMANSIPSLRLKRLKASSDMLQLMRVIKLKSLLLFLKKKRQRRRVSSQTAHIGVEAMISVTTLMTCLNTCDLTTTP